MKLGGSTRLHFVAGDPIAQVKSPPAITAALQRRGIDAVVIPAHVGAEDFATWLAAVVRMRNLDSVIVTVPHKFEAFRVAATSSSEAAFLRAANVLRRKGEGWHAEMFDGSGFIQAMRSKQSNPRDQSALVLGAGGAGTAIAHSLAMAGVRSLALFDQDRSRSEALASRLGELHLCKVEVLNAPTTDCDIVINASPAGMQGFTAVPIDLSRLKRSQFVGCVVTSPSVTALIEAARSRGCVTVTGEEMFEQVGGLIDECLSSPAP